jgi:hypothetical protein
MRNHGEHRAQRHPAPAQHPDECGCALFKGGMGNTRQELPTFIEFAVDTIPNDMERPAHAGGYCPFLRASGCFIGRCSGRFKKIFSLHNFPNIGSELFFAGTSPKPGIVFIHNLYIEFLLYCRKN